MANPDYIAGYPENSNLTWRGLLLAIGVLILVIVGIVWLHPSKGTVKGTNCSGYYQGDEYIANEDCMVKQAQEKIESDYSKYVIDLKTRVYDSCNENAESKECIEASTDCGKNKECYRMVEEYQAEHGNYEENPTLSDFVEASRDFVITH